MTKEEETGKPTGGNLIDEACGCCSGCCGIYEPDRNDPDENKKPTESGP